jgi:hypothetical protein
MSSEDTQMPDTDAGLLKINVWGIAKQCFVMGFQAVVGKGTELCWFVHSSLC